MIKYVCDRCSAMLEDHRVRFTLRIELFAAYDLLRLSRSDVAKERDIQAEIRDLIRKLEDEDPEKLTDEVYFHIEKDLCPKCREEVYREIRETIGGWGE